MSREASVSRLVLSEQVKDRLLQAILDGRFPPGARIVETRVARELGTSQAPVREALRDLEALGLVETSAFRGARVRRPSAEELLEAFVVRLQLESLAARLAVTTITDRDVDQMTGYLGEMRRAARADDPRAEAMADALFHGRLIELSGNATLQRVWRQLEPVSRTYLTLVIPGADRHRIADVHQPVLDALRHRDAAGATEALDRHYAVLGAMLTELWPAASTGLAPLLAERTP
jgi:DNA-binding GntR family transcriptional regulator